MATDNPHLFAEVTHSNPSEELVSNTQDLHGHKNDAAYLQQCTLVSKEYAQEHAFLDSRNQNLQYINLMNSVSQSALNGKDFINGHYLPVADVDGSIKDQSYSYCNLSNHQNDIRNLCKLGEAPPDKGSLSSYLSCQKEGKTSQSLHHFETSKSLNSNIESVSESVLLDASLNKVQSEFDANCEATNDTLSNESPNIKKSGGKKHLKKKKKSKRNEVPDFAVKLALKTLKEVNQDNSDRIFWFGRFMENEVRSLPAVYQTEFITEALKLMQFYKQKMLT